MAMECTYIKQEGNTLCGGFSFRASETTENIISSTYSIAGLVTIRFQADVIISRNNNRSDCRGQVSFSFGKYYIADAMAYKLTLQSSELKIRDQTFFCDHDWESTKPVLLMSYNKHGSNSDYKFNFFVNIIVSIKEGRKLLRSLHSDTDMTDFTLIAVDGSLPMHKVVLASQSSMIKSMFSDEWREAREGRIQGLTVTVNTLKHLKDYLYLEQLPNTSMELEALLDFACIHMIINLIQACTTKILFMITTKNAVRFLEVAHKFKLKKLLLGVLKISEAFDSDDHLQFMTSFGHEWI